MKVGDFDGKPKDFFLYTLLGRIIIAVVAVLLIAVLLTACSEKTKEPFRDAPQSGVRNSAPADIGEMPDGFSNWASKCDHGNRVYVIFKGNDNRGSIFVVKDDQSCLGK